MGFQIVLAVASETGYTLYRRSVPTLLDVPPEQVAGLAVSRAEITTGVSSDELTAHIQWQTDTGVFVYTDDEYWRALAVSLAFGESDEVGGLLVSPASGDSLLRLHVRSQGAHETGTVLYQDADVPAEVIRTAIETVLDSWGTVVADGR